MLSSFGSGDHPSSPQKHGRCDEQEGQDGFRGIAGVSPPPPPSCSFLGSTGFPGTQMLSFSNDAAGLGLSSGASMQGFFARVRGPFTPTQWMELEHQALIYKHIAANAPVPSSLLLPIRRSMHPWGRMRLSQRMDARMITRFKVRSSLRNYREMGIRTRWAGFALPCLATELELSSRLPGTRCCNTISLLDMEAIEVPFG